MKNSDFIDPDAFTGISRQERLTILKKQLTPESIAWLDSIITDISKQEMLTILKEQLTPESIAWLDSIINETTFSLIEIDQFKKFIIGCCYPELNVVDYQNNSKNLDICKPMLLFDEMFFPELQKSHYSFTHLNAEKKADVFRTFLLNMERTKEIYRTDHINTERIKCLPLLFTKVNNIDTFYLWVEKIIKAIKFFCTQNEEFAQAYRTKLEEIWNTYGFLRERLALYVNSDRNLIIELEQPSFKMLRGYLAVRGIWDNSSAKERALELYMFPFPFPLSGYYIKASYAYNHMNEDLLSTLLFVSLLQVEDKIQIPCWNEEDYFCRLLLDYGIINHSIGIVDALFRNHSVSDAFNIMRTHIDWRSNNIPHYQEEDYEGIPYEQQIAENRKKIISHRREFIKYLQAHVPILFSHGIPRQYRDFLYIYFFIGRIWPDHPMFENFFRKEFRNRDRVQDTASGFFGYYLTSKLELAINNNNLDLILEIENLSKLDIDNLFKKGNKCWPGKACYYKESEFRMETIQPLFPLLTKFWKNGDGFNLQEILKTSQYDADLLQILLIMKNMRSTNCPPLSLEDFTLKYLSLDIFDKVLSFSPFLEQNEDRYQNMLKKYPNLYREDALLERLLPCFTAIAIRNINEIPRLFDRILSFWDKPTFIIERWRQLNLCVLDKLCGMYEVEPDVISLIVEFVFKNYYYAVVLDIVKKYPQVHKLLLKYCYKTINSSWNTSMNLANVYAAANIIEIYKGAWHGLKSLLIVLRKTRKAWVDSGLKTDDSYLQNGDSNIVQEIKYHYTRLSPELSKQLRQDMANGLSDWLKPLPKSKRADLEKRLEEYTIDEKGREGFDITYTEPDPIWRYAYVRAIGDLGVDVDGKGHYIHTIMDKVAQNDPSAMVREAAGKTFIALKNLRDGWGGENHKRNISLAFWWIWQASRLAINLPVNRESALHMRNDISEYHEVYPKESINVSKRIEGKSKNEYEQTREKLMRERFGI